MSKKKIVIIGGSGSIGSSIAKEISSEKFEPHLIGRNFSSLKEVSEELNCSYEVADVTNTDNLTKALENCGEDIFGLAYCAGSIDLKPLRITRSKDFVSSYVLNLVAATDIIRTFQDNLKRNNGSIVMFSTVAAKKGFPNHSIISPAKAAVEGLTVALAAELAPHTRVNCIAPSLTKSKMSTFLLQNLKTIDSISKQHPLKRIGEGFDAANLAKFLLSKNSSWITGQIIGVDGGRATIA